MLNVQIIGGQGHRSLAAIAVCGAGAAWLLCRCGLANLLRAHPDEGGDNLWSIAARCSALSSATLPISGTGVPVARP
jgi:hypothetical protein